MLLSGRVDRFGTVAFVGDTSNVMDIAFVLETLKSEWPEIQRIFDEDIPPTDDDKLTELGLDFTYNLHQSKTASESLEWVDCDNNHG